MSTAEIALIVSIASGAAAVVGVVNSARALRWQEKRDSERREKQVTIHCGQGRSWSGDIGAPTEAVRTWAKTNNGKTSLRARFPGGSVIPFRWDNLRTAQAASFTMTQDDRLAGITSTSAAGR